MQLQYDQCYVFLQNNTALHFAAEKGSNKVITFLVDHGAGVNVINDVSYHTILLLVQLHKTIVTLMIIFQ